VFNPSFFDYVLRQFRGHRSFDLALQSLSAIEVSAILQDSLGSAMQASDAQIMAGNY